MSDTHKKRRPPFRQLTTTRSNRRLMPRLRQSLFARTRLRKHSRRGNPLLLSDITQMLRRIACGGDELRNESSLVHSEILFEALEPRILLSADGFMPPPTPDMFDDNPQQIGRAHV